MVKEYVNQAGYRIRASERAYNLLYKKNGFVPAEAGAKDASAREGAQGSVPSGSEEVINGDPATDVGEESPAEKTRRVSAGRKGGKSRKAATDQDATGQPGEDREQSGDRMASPDAENAADAPASQDAAGQPEGTREQSGDEDISPDAENAAGVIATQDATVPAAETREDK